LIIHLTKPIQAHGAEVTQLDIREPNGGDVAACGFPFRFFTGADNEVSILPEGPAITAMIARLGNIPRGSAVQLNLADWMECMNAVFSFFGQSVPTSSSGASILPGSGNGTLPAP
jgi:hypothetical protein